jgi:hypothetical protein
MFDQEIRLSEMCKPDLGGHHQIAAHRILSTQKDLNPSSQHAGIAKALLYTSLKQIFNTPMI